MYKLMRFMVGVALVSALTGCASVSPYSAAKNWIIRQNARPTYFAPCDIFYLSPTLFLTAKSPLWRIKSSQRQAVLNHLVYCQTRVAFGNRFRVFAPKINTLPLPDYLKILDQYRHDLDDLDDSPLQKSVEETQLALEYYLEHFHRPGAPFILLAEGQSAWALYQAMKNCSEVSRENGFVAAYLPGLPPITAKQIERDFRWRDIHPAQHARDCGVVITWNSTRAGAAQTWFNQKDNYLINPINWRTDSEWGETQEHNFALFYLWDRKKLRQRQIKIPHFCRARIVPGQGVLELDSVVPRTAPPNMVPVAGLFHSWNLAFFAGNIAQNAQQRLDSFIRAQKVVK